MVFLPTKMGKSKVTRKQSINHEKLSQSIAGRDKGLKQIPSFRTSKQLKSILWWSDTLILHINMF